MFKCARFVWKLKEKDFTLLHRVFSTLKSAGSAERIIDNHSEYATCLNTERRNVDAFVAKNLTYAVERTWTILEPQRQLLPDRHP